MGDRVIVCGGRNFGRALIGSAWWVLSPEQKLESRVKAHAEREALMRFLDRLQPSAIAHGGAPGADAIADDWATLRGVPCCIYAADWKRFGNSAGPRRNRAMFAHFKPNKLVACPGNRGTADMVSVVEKSMRPVLRVEVTADDLERARKVLG